MKLVARGARVGRGASRGPRPGTRCRGECAAGGDAIFVPCDVTDEASVDALFARIEADYGRLDAAFNNAGTESDQTPVPDTPIETFDQVFASTCAAPSCACGTQTASCARAAARRHREHGLDRGHHRLREFRRVRGEQARDRRHDEVGGLKYPAQGVRVNCLLPGATRSAMSQRWADRMEGGETAMAEAIPMKRLGTPDEQASVAVFLLSDAAAYMTGASVVVDGGLSVP